MDKKGFIIYNDIIDAVDTMSDAEAGALFRMILNYENGRESIEENMDEFTDTRTAFVIFQMIRNQLDRDYEKYEETCRRRAEAGKKGAEKRWQNIANATSDMANDSNDIANDSNYMAKMADKDTDTDKDKDTDTDKDIDIEKKNKKRKETAEAVVNLYHECCPSLPKVSKLNPMRIKLANARLKDYTMDELKAIFIKAENSTFLKEGQGTWNGANFDWILNQTNISKIEDGYYTDKEEPKEEEKTFYGYMYCDFSEDDRGYKECWDYDEWSKYNGWT